MPKKLTLNNFQCCGGNDDRLERNGYPKAHTMDCDEFPGLIPDLTKRELFSFAGVSDDFPNESNNYYAMRAIEEHGLALRDNTLQELIVIGKNIDLVKD